MCVPREVKNQHASASREDFPNNEIWTRCSNPKGTDVKYPKWIPTINLKNMTSTLVGKLVFIHKGINSNLDNNPFEMTN